MSNKMRLIGWLGTGPVTYHLGSWRYPTSEMMPPNIQWLRKAAQTLEDASFDAVFFADGNGLMDDVHMSNGGLFELMYPMVLASDIASHTNKIGIAITESTSFLPPFAVARALGTLDYVSEGRIAWNIVTSGGTGSREFGVEGFAKSERYERAAEFLEVCQRLWKSFPADALIANRETGQFIDTDQIDTFDYAGKHIRAGGPLNVPGSPQGGPVIIQAGGSEDGRNFAARHAELVFVMAATAADIRAYAEDLRRRAAEFGRDPTSVNVIAAVNVVVAETEAVAQERWDLLNSLISEDLAFHMSSGFAGIDLRALDPDSMISEFEPSQDAEHVGGISQMFDQMVRLHCDMTVREAAMKAPNSATPTLVGDAEQVADQLQALYEESSVAGFMINCPIMPAGFEDFARLVVPILQKRGIFRSEYGPSTLRERLSE